MKAIFMGSPAFALPALKTLISNAYDIIAVYTQPDKKTGRGQQFMSSPVKQYAISQGLRVVQPETFKNEDRVNELAEMRPDIIVVAAYGLILPEPVLNAAKHKCVNIHPSLLPKYRGPSPIVAAILNGDAVTGVTIMLVDKKVDSGPILSQKEMRINDDDTAETLSARLADSGAELMVATLPDWVSARIMPRIQDESMASYTRMETKEDGKLQWCLSALELSRKTRAYYPWPGCYADWKGGRLKIISAIPVEDSGDGNVGKVVEMPRGATARVAVRTADGLLGLLTVQPEGKKEMAASDFIVGHRDFIGSVL